MSQLGSCASHSLKETSWDFSAGVKSNYIQKEVKGVTSGEYLMAKYRPFIVSEGKIMSRKKKLWFKEGAVMSVKHASDLNHDSIGAHHM